MGSKVHAEPGNADGDGVSPFLSCCIVPELLLGRDLPLIGELRVIQSMSGLEMRGKGMIDPKGSNCRSVN